MFGFAWMEERSNFWILIGELFAGVSYMATGGVEVEARGMGTEYSVHAML